MPRNYQLLFEHAGVGIIELMFDGTILVSNPSAALLFGYSTEQLTSMNVLDITHPDDIHKTTQALEQVINGEVAVAVVEKRYFRADGSIVWSRSRVSLLRDDCGQAHSCVAVIADITELKEIQFSLRQANDHLHETLAASLLSLGLVLEARDLETSGHTQRVVALSAQLAQAFGLPVGEVEELKQGAYLHDIGKLTIPDAVLTKPASLDDDEWILMKKHAPAGHALASMMPTLSRQALLVIRHHHERWDGSGYPDGLAGEEIPLLARIFTVCDVYDALRSERPYKRAWTHEQAVAELLAEREKKFDPKVVATFIELTQRV
ncbi:HD domain-containing phosphohydrolase [Deinococcus sp. QL22]|uniref:HD domain-containing phosphohydrolase n=1 Tax=Deinococcus sp. QL22 TaxID=2939437 RepID=UPI002017DF29|nr:HD domain-containing phosphohydrolase [Deinococcus sp. QL22]UQN09350.1 PAS domain S-box protein [Deinococcus sp. QL22]